MSRCLLGPIKARWLYFTGTACFTSIHQLIILISTAEKRNRLRRNLVRGTETPGNPHGKCGLEEELKSDSCSHSESTPSDCIQIPGCAACLAALSKQTKRLCVVWCYVNWRVSVSSKSGSANDLPLGLARCCCGTFAKSRRGGVARPCDQLSHEALPALTQRRGQDQFRRHALDFKPQLLPVRGYSWGGVWSQEWELATPAIIPPWSFPAKPVCLQTQLHSERGHSQCQWKNWFGEWSRHAGSSPGSIQSLLLRHCTMIVTHLHIVFLKHVRRQRRLVSGKTAVCVDRWAQHERRYALYWRCSQFIQLVVSSLQPFALPVQHTDAARWRLKLLFSSGHINISCNSVMKYWRKPAS